MENLLEQILATLEELNTKLDAIDSRLEFIEKDVSDSKIEAEVSTQQLGDINANTTSLANNLIDVMVEIKKYIEFKMK